MFIVTQDMDIFEETQKRSNEITRLSELHKEERALGMASNDRYMIQGGDSEYEKEIGILHEELRILRKGYIDPALIEKAKQMYYEYNGGNYDTAGPNVQNAWIEQAKEVM